MFVWTHHRGFPETYRGVIDRSPCGSGTTAVMAALCHRSELKVGDVFEHFGTMGTSFQGKILEEVDIKPLRKTSFHTDINKPIPALIITIQGSAWITGTSTQIVDKTDPFPTGYTVRDIW